MPEDSKKSHDKKKNDLKEQRRPRQRQQQSAVEKKPEKKAEDPRNEPKVPQKPVYESPPPEFYKNLKRETDEILKITEEENSKYKKKEIQSNWSKYEMPIESYDEIEEHENLGADYEKLIQAPLSIGGHFQFKHEKSWDMNTGPSLYDKYFEINMEDLNVALCTIPFYERNSIDETNFSQTDILTMTNRSTRFKQKYYNDKSYSTPETEAQDKILNSLRESMKDGNSEKETNNDVEIKYDNDSSKTGPETENRPILSTDINLEFNTEIKTEPAVVVDENITKNSIKHEESIDKPNINNVIDNIENYDFEENNKSTKELEMRNVEMQIAETTVCHIEKPSVIDNRGSSVISTKATPTIPGVTPEAQPTFPNVAVTPVETKKNIVIESPEDLEKWLDDFLDG